MRDTPDFLYSVKFWYFFFWDHFWKQFDEENAVVVTLKVDFEKFKNAIFLGVTQQKKKVKVTLGVDFNHPAYLKGAMFWERVCSV